MESARDWLSRPEDWDALPLADRRCLAAEVVELVQREGDPVLLRRASAFLRQAGWVDDAVEQARLAWDGDASWESAVVLAGALRSADQGEEAVRLFREALRLRPDDPGPHLDLGDMLAFELNRRPEGLQAFAAVLEDVPDHPHALPAWLYLQALEGDPDAGPRLLEIAEDDVRLATAWKWRNRPYWGTLPEPVPSDGPVVLGPLLRLPYHLQFWLPVAERLALALEPGDILPHLTADQPLAVQIAAALVLSRMDEEWEPAECLPGELVAAGTLPHLQDWLWTVFDERPELQPLLSQVLSWGEKMWELP